MRYLMASCLLMLAPLLCADTVYRHVDREGNVSYTSTRPQDVQGTVEEVTLRGGPSEESRALAKQRQNEIKEAGGRLATEREETARARQQQQELIQRAKRELEQAERNRQTAMGSRYGHGSARVKATEEGVELARKRLLDIRKRPDKYLEEYQERQQ